jgi:hypothetical protein
VRLLIVEDEREFAETLRRGLVAEGFTVDVAHTGREGLWRATEQEYDVVVLDIMLPELSGYEVLKRLRAAENWTPSTTKPTRSTSAPTTTCRSRSPSSSSSPGCARCCGAARRPAPPCWRRATCASTPPPGPSTEDNSGSS